MTYELCEVTLAHGRQFQIVLQDAALLSSRARFYINFVKTVVEVMASRYEIRIRAKLSSIFGWR